ncbi:MAG: BON domain-containing protein [Alphaproteobacteria bacterium]|nr:BON domain-containing protein [Alphaproteobacteria bacterium]
MKIYKSIAKISLAIFGLYAIPVIADVTDNNHEKGGTTMSYIFSDTELQSKINDELESLGGDLSNRIELAVQDARIIVIGYVRSQNQHDQAIKAIKKVGGYRELIDKIEINSEPKTLIRDAITTTKMKAYLATEKGKYAVTTVDRVIYIVGSAKTEEQKQKIIDYAKSLSNVFKVVEAINVTR